VSTFVHDGSAWVTAIVPPVPTKPYVSACAALASDRYGGLSAFAAPPLPPESPASFVADGVPDGRLVELIDASAVDRTSIDELMRALTRNRELLPGLAGLDSVLDLTGMVRRWQAHRGLAELKRAVRDPAVETSELRQLLQRERWMFGGHLVPWIRDEVVPALDHETIPLIQFDGALQIVSVERPHVPDLVTGSGGQYSLSPLVTAACDRARTMIRALDSNRDVIGERLGISYGRVLVTIVIGHPDFVAELDTARIRDEIRSLNTVSAGITVMTYEALTTIAERTLNPALD
jgi:hypothetical protein